VPRRCRAPATVRNLRDQLIATLPGYDEAPRGWTEADLERASGQALPPRNRLEDPRIAQFAVKWGRLDVRLHLTMPSQEVGLGEPRIVVDGSWDPLGTGGFVPVFVRLCEDERSARRVYAQWVKEKMLYIGREDAHVYRWGTTVALTHLRPGYDCSADVLDTAMGRYGMPDEEWWSLGEPMVRLGAALVANRVSLRDKRSHPYLFSYVARTARERKIILEKVAEDDPAAGLIAQVDLKKQSVILLVGVFEVEDPTGAHVHAVPLSNGEDGHMVIVDVSETTAGVATVLVVDKLPLRPTEIQVAAPNRRLDMPVYER
jgi:hypothetical protein